MTRKFKIYNNGNIDKRVYEGDNPPDGFILGSCHRHQPWNKGLTSETDERVKHYSEKRSTTISSMQLTPWNKGKTKFDDERIHGMVGTDNPMFGKHTNAWNKGLTKDTDERLMKMSKSRSGSIPWNKGKPTVGHQQSQETRDKIRQTHSSSEFKQQRHDLMKSNGTLFVKESKAEREYHNYLLSKYGEDDVKCQYFDAQRYPFNCDFYVPSEDLFIEVHKNWTHGKHPFNADSEEDIKTLNEWQEKAKTSDYYKNAIYTWTDLDVRKRNFAKTNNLNYLVIY